jgi:uncharacterized membrane protein YphA (DoxX/SURF4 family)
LLRFFWGLILWARWADELLPFRRLEWWYWVLSVLFFIGTTGMVIGLFSRLSSLLAGVVTLAMVFVLGHKVGIEPWTHHHTTFLAVVTFILALTPCGKSFSLDRWIAIRRAEKTDQPWPKEWGNVWAVRLVALQLSAIYFWGAVDKVRWAYLGGDRVEQPLMYLYIGSDFPGEWFHWLAIGTAFATVTLEFTLTVGLWIRRVQLPLMVAGFIFHAGLYYFLPVTVFSIASMVAYLAYLHPDDVHRAFGRMLSRGPAEE